MTTLQGRALVAAMCAGQVGNLLPHVVVPAIMAQHLIPLWGLSATQAGLMASAYAFGYMLAVPVLTALTDRLDARGILLGGSLLSGIGHDRIRIVRRRFAVGIPAVGARRCGLRRRLHAGPESAHRPPSRGRRVAQRDALHIELLGRCRAVVSDLADRRGPLRLARGLPDHRPRPAADDRHMLDARPLQAQAPARAPARFSACPAQPHGARLHLRLRRALLRALRAAHLAGGVLGLRRGAQ